MKVARIDLSTDGADRALSRARRRFLREAALAAAWWPVRAEAWFGRVIEPVAAAAGAAAMLLWAISVGFGG